MSLPAFFESPRRSRAATAAIPHSIKVCVFFLALAVLLPLLSSPAYAGSWVVTYETHGTSAGETERNNAADGSWPSGAPDQLIWLDMNSSWIEDPSSSPEDFFSTCHIYSEGDVTAVFTWTGGMGDDPPAILNALEISNAYAYPMHFPAEVYSVAPPPVSVADNGLGDAVTHNYEDAESKGSHLIQISTGGQRVVRLPLRHLAASITYPNILPLAPMLDEYYEEVLVSYSAQEDPRKVTLHRHGARQNGKVTSPDGKQYGEWIDPDGTAHGDTTYSYITATNSTNVPMGGYAK